MMKTRKVWYIITIISLIIGFMLAIQYNSTRKATKLESRDITELRAQLSKALERKDLLLNNYTEKKLLLNQYSQNEKQQQVLMIMLEELKKTEILAGLVPIQGKGAVITIIPLAELATENQPVENLIIDDDIRTLVNELFANGAQAISINGQRLISTSAIRNVGYQIQVNNQFIHFPYEIKVIGDFSVLKAGLQLAGLLDYFQLLNKQLVIEEQEIIEVPAYTGNVTSRYMKPVKAGGY